MIGLALAILLWLGAGMPPKQDLCQHRYEQDVRQARSPLCPGN